MKQKGFAPLFLLPVILVGLIVVYLIYAYTGSILNAPIITSPKGQNKACTMEAKICPDGSSVGRTGANCEFSPCPSTSSAETADWKTYTNNPWKYSFQYPSNFQVIGENMGKAEENIDVIAASLESIKTSKEYLDYPFLRVLVIPNVTTDLESYAVSSYDSNKINNQLNSKLEKFVSQNLTGWKYDFSGKVFNTTGSEGKTDGNSGFGTHYAGNLKVVFLQNKDNIYVILLADTDPFNKILATFKFNN